MGGDLHAGSQHEWAEQETSTIFIQTTQDRTKPNTFSKALEGVKSRGPLVISVDRFMEDKTVTRPNKNTNSEWVPLAKKYTELCALDTQTLHINIAKQDSYG